MGSGTGCAVADTCSGEFTNAVPRKSLSLHKPNAGEVSLNSSIFVIGSDNRLISSWRIWIRGSVPKPVGGSPDHACGIRRSEGEAHSG
jgi:hypothetical protein